MISMAVSIEFQRSAEVLENYVKYSNAMFQMKWTIKLEITGGICPPPPPPLYRLLKHLFGYKIYIN